MANILNEVQNFVVGKLSSDSELSGNCAFIAENKKDIEYEIKNALGRQGICGIVMTPKALYAGKFEDQSLVWQLDELEIDIVENVAVNRGKKYGNYMTGQDIAMQMFNVLCPLSGESEGQFSPVSLEEGEDNGLLVNRCVFKCLVHGGAEEPGPSPEPPLQFSAVKLFAEEPPLDVTRKDGWIWPSGD